MFSFKLIYTKKLIITSYHFLNVFQNISLKFIEVSTCSNLSFLGLIFKHTLFLILPLSIPLTYQLLEYPSDIFSNQILPSWSMFVVDTRGSLMKGSFAITSLLSLNHWDHSRTCVCDYHLSPLLLLLLRYRLR